MFVFIRYGKIPEASFDSMPHSCFNQPSWFYKRRFKNLPEKPAGVAFLDCSDPYNGFPHVKNKVRGHEYLLAFSSYPDCFQSVILVSTQFLILSIRRCNKFVTPKPYYLFKSESMQEPDEPLKTYFNGRCP